MDSAHFDLIPSLQMYDRVLLHAFSRPNSPNTIWKQLMQSCMMSNKNFSSSIIVIVITMSSDFLFDMDEFVCLFVFLFGLSL